MDASAKGAFLLIANPVSGAGKAVPLARRAYRALQHAGHRGKICFTRQPGDAKRFAQTAIARGIRWIIVCGGDGTQHEILNGVAATPQALSDVILGVLPCGGGSDFAKAVGISTHPQRAIQTLLQGEKTIVDVGVVYPRDGAHATPHYFNTIVTCGYDAAVTQRAAQQQLPFGGTAAYVYAAIATLFKYQCPFAKISGDFETYSGYLLLAATGITNRYGGGFKIVPAARYDDGLFDVCVVRPVPSLTILRLLITLFWGGHTKHPAVAIHQTRTVTIETDPPLQLYADGEPLCKTPVTIETRKHALTVLTPSI